jgi:hypothetical protein
MGGIRPEFGALFGPNKSIRAGENLFAWDSALLRASPVPFVRYADAEFVTSKIRRGLALESPPPRRAVSLVNSVSLGLHQAVFAPASGASVGVQAVSDVRDR